MPADYNLCGNKRILNIIGPILARYVLFVLQGTYTKPEYLLLRAGILVEQRLACGRINLQSSVTLGRITVFRMDGIGRLD